MRTAVKAIGLLSVVLTISIVVSANHPVSPDEIGYDAVPGYGIAGGTEILEWAEKSSSTPGEAPVFKALDPPPGLKIRWLGTAGFEISDDETTILIDPFVSRPTVAKAVFKELPIDTSAVDRYVLGPIERSGGLKKIKAILISHTHYDHVQDAPYVLAKFQHTADRPLIVGDRNLVDVLKKYCGKERRIPWLKGIDPLDKSPRFIIDFNEKQLKPNPPASERLARPVGQFGNFKITAFISWHGLYDDLSLSKDLSFTLAGKITGNPPYKGADLRAYLNTSMTYLIEYKDQFRIFAVDSPRFLHSERVSAEIMAGGPIDVLLEGIASRKTDNAIPARITGFHPVYLVPTHFDNFFIPLDEFKVFDFKIMLFTDNSNLKGFIDDYRYAGPKLRMMKMFYYYSMDHLLHRSSLAN